MGLIYEQEVKKAIQEKYAAFLIANEKLLQCGVSLLPDGTKLPGKISQKVLMATIALHSKAAKTFRSINILAETGLGADAIGVLRTLSEALFTLCYLLKENQTERASKYLMFVSAVQNSNRMKDFDDGSAHLKELNIETNKMAEKVKKKFGKKWWEEACRGKWDGKSIKKMAQEIGLEPLYSQVYGFASQITHASDTTEHLTLNSDGSLLVKIYPSMEWVEAVLLVANEVYRLIITAVSQALELNREKEILDISLYPKEKPQGT